MNLLAFKDVSFTYPNGVQALKNISFEIAQGEFVALIGRNGSGKTTILQNIMNLLEPTQGEISLLTQPIRGRGISYVAESVGYVFQNPSRQMFLPTVLAEVAYGPIQQGLSKEAAEKKAKKVLNEVGISHLAAEYPKALSRGEIQRVAIAIAMALEPKLIILDEPTSGQDGPSTRELRDLLKEMHQSGMTILLVTHDMELLAESAVRSIVMAQGQKVFDGLTAELFSECECEKWGLEFPVWLDIARRIPELPPIEVDRPDQLVQEIFKRQEGGPK